MGHHKVTREVFSVLAPAQWGNYNQRSQKNGRYYWGYHRLDNGDFLTLRQVGVRRHVGMGLPRM